MRTEVIEFITRVTTDDEFIARIPADVDEITRAKIRDSHIKEFNSYCDKIQKIYGFDRPIEALEKTLESDILDLLVEFNRQDRAIIKNDPEDKHRIAMFIIGEVLVHLICYTYTMGIQLKQDFYNRYKQTPFMFGQTFSEFVEDTYKKENTPPSNDFDEEAIKKELEKNTKFEQKSIIRLKVLYDLMIDNGIINKKCSIKLFEYCLNRADVTKIMTERSKTLLRTFMVQIAYKYSQTDEYLRAAEISFGVEPGKLGATGNASKKYDDIFGEDLPRIDHRTKYRT